MDVLCLCGRTQGAALAHAAPLTGLIKIELHSSQSHSWGIMWKGDVAPFPDAWGARAQGQHGAEGALWGEGRFQKVPPAPLLQSPSGERREEEGEHHQEREEAEELGAKEGSWSGEKERRLSVPAISGTVRRVATDGWQELLSLSFLNPRLFKGERHMPFLAYIFKYISEHQMEHTGIAEGGILLSEIEAYF